MNRIVYTYQGDREINQFFQKVQCMSNNDINTLRLLPLACNFIQVIISKIDIRLPDLNKERGGWGMGGGGRLSCFKSYFQRARD